MTHTICIYPDYKKEEEESEKQLETMMRLFFLVCSPKYRGSVEILKGSSRNYSFTSRIPTRRA